MKIEYWSKERLRPYFGYNYPDRDLVVIREDLPMVAKYFTAAHESYHLTDKAKWVVWREIKANLYGAWHYPVGFLWVLSHTFNRDRLFLYWNRIRYNY